MKLELKPNTFGKLQENREGLTGGHEGFVFNLGRKENPYDSIARTTILGTEKVFQEIYFDEEGVRTVVTTVKHTDADDQAGRDYVVYLGRMGKNYEVYVSSNEAGASAFSLLLPVDMSDEPVSLFPNPNSQKEVTPEQISLCENLLELVMKSAKELISEFEIELLFY